MPTNINTSNNTVVIQPTNYTVTVTNNNVGSTTNVTNPYTTVINVASLGPQGIPGVQGVPGDSVFSNLGGGIFATTSSIQVTGSFTVSGSSTFTNIGPAVFSGSTAISGALTVNGYDIVTVNQTSSLTVLSASHAATASYLNTLNQNLTFNGNLTLNGTASIAYLNVQYESASIIYSSGSNQLGDAANDTQTLYGSVVIPTGSLIVSGSVSFGTSSAGFFWNNTNNRLGIGTSSPASPLHVNGDIRVNAGQAIILDSSNNIYAVGGGNQYRIYSGGTASLNIATNGNTLIGTTTDAGYKLDVSGSARITNGLTVTGSAIISSSASTQLQVGSNFLFVSSSGNVGVGTTSPAYGIHHVGTIGVAGIFSQRDFGFSAFSQISQRASFVAYTTDGSNGIGIGANGTAGLIQAFTGTIGSPSARILSLQNLGGNVSIGTTTDSARLQVRGSGTTSATTALRVENTNASASLVVLDNGFVGIGTSSAQYQLDVYGTYHQYQAQGGIARYDISSANANQNKGVWDFYTNAAVSPDFFGRFGFKFEGGTADSFKQFQLHVADSTTPKFVVDGSGRVGIGTILPTASLHISASTTSSAFSFLVQNSSGQTLFSSQNDRTVNINSTNATNGNTTIGTTNGTITFNQGYNNTFVGNALTFYNGGVASTIQGFTTNPGIAVGYAQTTTNPNTGSVFTVKGTIASSGSGVLFVTGSSATRLLRVSSETNADILVVSGSGNVGIGTITPDSYYAKKLVISSPDESGITIAGISTSATNYLAFADGTSGNQAYRGYISYKHLSDQLAFGSSGTLRATIDSAGNFGIGTSTNTILARTHIQGSGATSATTTFLLQNSTPTNLLSVLDNGQVAFASPTITLAVSQSAFSISPIISASNIVGGQYYGVNITPTFYQTTASQTETAFRVAATFSQSSAAATGGTNIIADFGSTSAGSQLTVTDVTSGSIYMVNDVSGIPIIEATSNWDVNMYDFPNKVFEKTGTQVNIYGTMRVSGSFILPLSQSAAPQLGSAYWSGSLLFIYNGTRYMSASFA